MEMQDLLAADGVGSLVAILGALGGGLMILAIILIAGGWILRCLGIAVEAPESYLFEPPPTALESGSVDRQAAIARAQARRALQPRYQRAQAIWQAWAEIRSGTFDLAAREVPGVNVQQWLQQADACQEALLAAMPRLPLEEDVLAPIEKQISTLHGEVKAVWERHVSPPPQRMMLWLALALVVALAVAATVVLQASAAS